MPISFAFRKSTDRKMKDSLIVCWLWMPSREKLKTHAMAS
jgi:hypothetical protein